MPKINVNGSWIPSNTEQSSCKPLLFSQSATNRVSFALNAWKLVFAMIYHATYVESAWLVTLNRDPHPWWVVIKCPAPGKTKLIKFPPSWAGKDVKCPGYAGGGMLKLRFDWYITLHGCQVSRDRQACFVNWFCSSYLYISTKKNRF